MAAGHAIWLLLIAWISCALPFHVMAAGIWEKGQWEKDGAINVFNHVTVQKDGSIDILAKFEGVTGDFSHSLSRPHASNALAAGVPNMKITGVMVDGKAAKAMVGKDKNGIPATVKIVSPGPGPHTYILRLKAYSRILFSSPAYDELVWEPGNAFELAEKARVSCSVSLPEGAELLGQSAWLGKDAAHSKKTLSWKSKSGSALYRAEAYMEPGESFAITARWSKGAVVPPGIWSPEMTSKNGSYGIHNVVTIQKDGTIDIEAAYLRDRSGHFYHSLRRVYVSSSRFGESAPVEFVSATVDGKPVKASLIGSISSIHIKAPSEGPHDYVLHLKTTDCVLFGNKSYDEFTWEIPRTTPKARVSCVIKLPEGAEVLGQTARLGHETTNHKPVKMTSSGSEAIYKGMGYMGEGESFVVTVRFSKGFVSPSASAKAMAHMELGSWIMLAIAVLFCTFMWWFFGKDPVPSTIVPRFYPPVLPDGTILSPAQVAYVHDSARLKSRGFVGLLLNLAVQKALAISGSGTKKDPYILSPGKEDSHASRSGRQSDALADGRPAEAELNRRWNALIRRGTGFDEAERSVISCLLDDGDQHIVGKQSSWIMAMARGEAYLALSEELRSAWRLRADKVLIMHLVVYLALIVFLAVSGATGGSGGYAVVCAIITLGALLSWLYHVTMRKVHRFVIEWEEMGWQCIGAFLLLCTLIPLILLYDFIIAPHGDMHDFAGYAFMESWTPVRLLLVPVLAIFLYRRTRSAAAAFIGPLKFLGFLLLFILILGVMWAMNFPGTSSLALLLALVSPTVFMPIMKQPSPEALQLMADIEGFAMYIKTAETKRLDLLNAPGRTPEEFERVMPYAVALGLENAWGAKFTDIAAQLHFSGSLGTLDEFQHRLDGI